LRLRSDFAPRGDEIFDALNIAGRRRYRLDVWLLLGTMKESSVRFFETRAPLTPIWAFVEKLLSHLACRISPHSLSDKEQAASIAPMQFSWLRCQGDDILRSFRNCTRTTGLFDF
jgi:hypothetical protein